MKIQTHNLTNTIKWLCTSLEGNNTHNMPSFYHNLTADILIAQISTTQPDSGRWELISHSCQNNAARSFLLPRLLLNSPQPYISSLSYAPSLSFIIKVTCGQHCMYTDEGHFCLHLYYAYLDKSDLNNGIDTHSGL